VPEPDIGWLTYIAKNHIGFRPGVRSLLERHGSRLGPTFQGPWIAASKSVRAQARQQYNEWRAARIAAKV
jgi:hypothetical protein